MQPITQKTIFARLFDAMDTAMRQQGYILNTGNGCAPTAHGAGSLQVDVASGYFTYNSLGAATSYAGGNITLTAADATRGRVDIVYFSSAGALAKTDGTPLATNPIPPGWPAGSTPVAICYVGPGTTDFATTSYVFDVRQFVRPSETRFSAGNITGATTADFTVAGRYEGVLTGAVTFTFTAPIPGQKVTVKLTQDGVGSRTVTWPAAVTWLSGLAPVLTTTASATDEFEFYYDGTTYWGRASTPKLPNNTTTFARGDGAYATPPSATVSAVGYMATTDKQALTKQSVTGGTVTVDFSAGLTYELTTNANAAFTLTNGVTGAWHAIIIHYGGTHTVTFTTTVNWPGATTPTWTSTVSKTDIVFLFLTTGGNWIGDSSLNFSVAS